MKRIPKNEYDNFVGTCDVGLIFLDHRFMIPNFHSTLLNYMQAKIPVLVVTDPNPDVGKVIVNGGFGWWCESDNVSEFADVVKAISRSKIFGSSEQEFQYLLENYTNEDAYNRISKHF